MRRVSVIPVMVHPEQGVYVLLGRNRGVSWEGAARWGDFGGRPAKGEDEEEALAREVAEESLETLVKYHERHIFSQSLKEKHYVYKLTNQFNTTYVIRFAWDPSKMYEFSLLRKTLLGLHKLSRGLSLSGMDQQALARYRWFCRDTRLQKVLQHPAIRVSRQILSERDLGNAQTALGQALGISARTSRGGPAIVIEEVSSAWLEKDSLQLFSLEQIRLMLCAGSVWCRGSSCMELDGAVRPALGILCSMMRFHGCPAESCPIEPSNS